MGALPEWEVEGGGEGGGDQRPMGRETPGRRVAGREGERREFPSEGAAKSRELFMEWLLKSYGWVLHSQNMLVRATCHHGKRRPPLTGNRSGYAVLVVFLGRNNTRNAR